MVGVVSLLDEENSTFIRELWAGLTKEFGFSGTHADSSPHVSFHVAAEYDMDAVDARLQSLAKSIPPFEAQTNGIGIFPGDEIVVHLPVIRQPRLTVMQRAVFDEIRHCARGDEHYYRPDQWVPHITLGRWDRSADVVADVVRYLASRELDRSFPVDNLSVIEETGETRRVVCRYPLEP
jgi:2'-5' RNA ligase